MSEADPAGSVGTHVRSEWMPGNDGPGRQAYLETRRSRGGALSGVNYGEYVKHRQIVVETHREGTPTMHRIETKAVKTGYTFIE